MTAVGVDAHEADHHWEDLERGDSNLDLSWKTVEEHHGDHALTNGKVHIGKPVDLPNELVVATGEISPISSVLQQASTSASTKSLGRNDSSKVTTYEDVTYHGEVGSLILSRSRIVFQPHDEHGEAPVHQPEKHPHHAWRWKAIKKHQISPAKSGKIMLKLISSIDEHKAVTFSFVSREELDFVRKDVSKRMRLAKQQQPNGTNTNTPVKPKGLPPPLEASPDGTAATSLLDTSGEVDELETIASPLKACVRWQDEQQPTESTALLTTKCSTLSSESEGFLAGNTIAGFDRTKVLAAGAVALVGVVILVVIISQAAGAPARLLAPHDGFQVAPHFDAERFVRHNPHQP